MRNFRTMTRFRAILAGASLIIALPAQAQKIDLSKMTCRQFLDASKENYTVIMTWLSGYFADEDEPAVIDFDKIKGQGEMLRDYCRRHPTDELMEAAEEVMEK
jgi:acid stress chaperone HdeB